MWTWVLFSSLAAVTYWQSGRCVDRDLGGEAKLTTCAEAVVVTEDGSLELQVSWKSSGLSGKRLEKGSDSGNRRMYLVDGGGKRYDHIGTRGAALDGGRIEDGRPALRGVFVFPAPSPDSTTFTFKDDDQKTAIDGITLSAENRTDHAASIAILGRVAQSQSVRVDYRWRGPRGEEREGYRLTRAETGFRAEALADGEGTSTIPDAPLPPSVMDSFFEILATSPLLEREFEPVVPRTDDYPAITIDARKGNENVFFFSRSQGQRLLPWNAQSQRKRYVVPDDTPLRALAILEPFFGLDARSRALKLLGSHFGEEEAFATWTKLENHAGMEEALRVTRRLKGLLDGGVENAEILQAVEDYVRPTPEPPPPLPAAPAPATTAETRPAPAPGGANQFLAAVARGETEEVRALVGGGSDVDARGRDGKTALMLAAEAGHVETLQILLDGGADPNLQTLRGGTALALAAQNHQTEATRILLRAGANPNLKESDGSTPLMLTADGNVVRALIRAGADVNARDENGLTPMMRLIEGGAGAPGAQRRAVSVNERADSLRSLLTAGANVRAKDKQGRTALIWATKGTPSTPSYPALVTQLIEAGSELDARDREGGTALVYSVIRGDVASARLLIEAGADVNVQMGNLSAMDIALRYGQSEIATLLLRAGSRR